MKTRQKYGLTAKDIAHVGVYLVEKNNSLMDVIQLMDRVRISAVIVEDLDDLAHYYIISQKDLIRFFARQRSHLDFIGFVAGVKEIAQETKAQDIMRGPIDIIDRETPIDEIIRIMHEKGFKRLIVGNDQHQPIGIVSTADIIAWGSTTDIFKKGSPILLCVLEMDTGILLAQKFFQQNVADELMEILGGSLSAINSVTQEVFQTEGDLKVIEKEAFQIMLERIDNVTAVLVTDHASISLRLKLQEFIKRFVDLHGDDLQRRKRKPESGRVDQYKIRDLADLFL